MDTSRNARVAGAVGLLILFCVAGCKAPFSKPPLCVNAQAEAFSHFSRGLLAEANGDSEAALRNIEAAIRIDPEAWNLYPPAVAIALKLEQPEKAFQLAEQLRFKCPDRPESRLLLARVYALTEQPEEAHALFEEATRDFPAHPDTHLSLARLLLLQGRNNDSVQTLRNALKTTGENAEILNLLGSLIVESSRSITNEQTKRQTILEGIELFDRSLQLDPSNPANWQKSGQVHLFINQPEQALEAFKQARKKMSGDVVLARQVLELTLQTREYEEALALTEALPGQTRMEPELWFQYLTTHTPPEDRQKLIKYLEEKLAEKTPQRFYYTQLSSLYLDEKQMDEAEAIITKALSLYPDDIRLRTAHGCLYLQKEKFTEAYSAFKTARELQPDSEWVETPFFTLNFMVAAQKSDHLEEAVSTLAACHTNDPTVLDYYMHALLTGESPVSAQAGIEFLSVFKKLQPEAIEALYYLTLLQAEEEEHESALATAQQFEQLAEDLSKTNLLDSSFYFQYASLYERTGQLEEAEKLFFRSIELGDPSVIASAQNYIAYMWAERGEKLELGLDLIAKALAAEPDNPAFIDTLGWIYYMQERYEEALSQLKTASELLTDDPVIWEHLGDTYSKLGNSREATENWKKALELLPDEERLINRLKEAGFNPDDPQQPVDSPEDRPLHP